jgi:hypothetical protein
MAGDIVRQFGDASAVSPLLGGLDSPLLQAWNQASCLDDIFACRRVNMVKLQNLFGLHRNRFPQDLPSVKVGREVLYDDCAVRRIMEALLSENSGERKSSVRGKRPRLWLSNPVQRTRVLKGIEGRIMSFATELRKKMEVHGKDKADQDTLLQVWQKEVADPFLAIVRDHLPDSAKK